MHKKAPSVSGTKGTLRGTTLVEPGERAPLHSMPVTVAAGIAYAFRRERHSSQASSALALLGCALPRSHPNAALCEDGLLLLFITFYAVQIEQPPKMAIAYEGST